MSEQKKNGQEDLKEYAGQEVDGRAVLQSTVAKRKEYPDSLYRLWRAPLPAAP